MSLSREDNITWSLPVDFGFSYLIRLHLSVQRSRNFVNENGMAVHVDVQEMGVLVYRDFIVNLSRKHQGDVFVSVSIQYNRSSVHNVPFLNGFEIFKLSDENNSLAGSNPFKARKVSLSANHFIARTVYYILLTVVGVSIYSALISLQLPLPSSFKWKIRTVTCLPLSKDCPHFTLAEIESATENFSAAFLLCSGGGWERYTRGLNTLTAVAIKRSNPELRQGINEFQTEITIISKLRHCHLVSLIGCCMGANELVLVYSFVARGTLADHLYKTKESTLPWKKRWCSSMIALSPHVVREAILLDENWEPKLSDFRPSKIGPNMTMTESETHVSTWIQSIINSVKNEEDYGKVNLADWALNCYQMGTLEQNIDPFLQGKINPECFKTFTGIAKKCLADKEATDLLAWRQEMKSSLMEANGTHGMTDVNFTPMIDGQQLFPAGNSEPTPGVEFSEIIVPTGR
ncbi:hypothetical protein CXB51_004352 [Gossypium anomalum]|uniref:Serine-threonine/tyrosine-protein kinase catalytic domain-containing protein n=1 Tax=Gossypium anomalum TaxID=47600 RepID=A0A8J5Z3Y1_9ROSI|nr:hypothetical protein CXB51_004352 [Gossypium anomalum]